MGLTTTTSKHVLLLLNFIFTVLGLILVGFGIFVLCSGPENDISYGEDVVAGVIIALGVLIVLVAIFGALAAIHQVRHKLMVYIISIVILILMQLIMLSMVSQGTRDGLSGSVRKGFEDLWEIEHRETGALAYYENWLHCCGVNGTADYGVIHHEIPKSCCIMQDCSNTNFLFKRGCQQTFLDYLSDKLLIFKIVCWVLVVSECIAAFLSWLMYRSLKNDSRRTRSSYM